MGKKKTHEEFCEEVYELVGEEYSILGKYMGGKTKILMRHNNCGYEFYMKPSKFLHDNQRCPECSKKLRIKSITKSHDIFIKQFKEIYKDEYDILDIYKGSFDYVTVIHNVCGTKYLSTPNNLLTNHSKCSMCSNIDKTKTINKFKNKVYKLYGEEYEVIGEYVNAKTKIKIKHNICGYIWDVCPDNFIREVSHCPRCKMSQGEKIIDNYLYNNNYLYDYQYSFNDCKSKNALPFDFVIFDSNYNVLFLIEFDGQQHFYPVRFNNISIEQAELIYKEIIKRDKIKNKYCYNNNIKLIRIPYWEQENIIHILNKELKYA